MIQNITQSKTKPEIVDLNFMVSIEFNLPVLEQDDCVTLMSHWIMFI